MNAPHDRHPGLEVLADLADGRRRGSGGRTAAAHATSCSDCGGTVESLRFLVARIASGAAVEPPRAVLRAAFRIPARSRAAAVVEAARTFVARLVFDSLADAVPSPVPALRGAVMHQRLFRAGPWEVEVLRTGDSVRGSVVPAEESAAPAVPVGGRVAALRGKRTAASADLDARGRFVLDGLAGGRYSLRIEIDGQEILVEAIDL